MPDENFCLLLLILLFCTLIFLYDYLFRRVPNHLLLIAIAVQLGWLVLQGEGLNGMGWGSSLAGFAIGLIFFLPLYALRAMAAGDVKFFATLGFLLGPGALLPVFLIASVIAAVHAAMVYASRLGLMPSFQLVAIRVTQWSWYQRVLERRGNRVGIPYAAYLALAAVWIELSGAGIMQGFA